MELSRAHAQIHDVRKNWFQVFEDLEQEIEQPRLKKDAEIRKLEQRMLEVEHQRDEPLIS